MMKPVCISTLLLCSLPAIAGMTFDTPEGNLKLYGDVEFNIDGASRAGQLTSNHIGGTGTNWKPGSAERQDVNGRILIGLDGYRTARNNQYAGFKVQPLADISGKMNLDDALFFFGQEKDWEMKVGRYEAYDMFPLNQDTFIEYSGNSANDLYDDGYGYIYQMKEGRGRTKDGGSLQINKTAGPLYFELNAMSTDGTLLFADSYYHGYELENKKNALYLRPVVALTVDDITAAIAMDTNVVKDAYGYRDAEGNFHNQSKRNGYGANFTWNGQKSNPDDGIVLNVSAAYLDATGEKDFSAGTNALWRDIQIGYIYAKNDVKQYNPEDTQNVEIGEVLIGKYDVHTLHTSYRIRNVMDMSNFNIFLGAYWSRLSMDTTNDSENRYGARVRFKYFF